MNRRALLISVVMALIGSALLVLYLRKFEREMSGGEPVEVLMVVKPIERGQTITEDALATRFVPLAYVEDRAVKAAERSKVLGLEASVGVSPQQTLMWTDLAVTTEDRDLSALVQPGKRGVTVRAGAGGEDNRGNALIRPGDYVDVIATMPGEGENSQPASVVLLQRVLVLAVGNETQNASANAANADALAQRDKLLTLSLTLPEAQLLSLALERGRLSVAVRQPEDPGVQTDIPDMLGSTLFDTRARAGVQRAPRPANDGPVRIDAVNIR
jgi:pilus assembly protein CpaB